MISPDRRPGNFLTRNWDLLVSVVVSAAFGISAWIRDEELKALGAVLASGIGGGVAIGAAALVMSRWMSDSLAKDEYGELIRMVDESETRVRRPYEIVAFTSFLTSLGCLVTVLFYDAVPAKLVVCVSTLLLGLGLYSILGAFTLIRITRRHQARAARIRALKERNQREQRRRKRES